MSKEKNLTYVAASGDPATKDVHEWIGIIHGPFYTGPAIDRLHEFEKLGMEPEEIKEILNSNLVRALSENVKLKEENEKLKASVGRCYKVIDSQNDFIKELKAQSKNQDGVIEQLRTMNQKQYENISELQKEIEKRERAIEKALQKNSDKLQYICKLEQDNA